MNKITILAIVFFVNMQISFSHGPPTRLFDTPSSTATTLVALGSLVGSIFFIKEASKSYKNTQVIGQPIILLESYKARAERCEEQETGIIDFYFDGTDEEINEAQRLADELESESGTGLKIGLKAMDAGVKQSEFFIKISEFSAFISFSSCLYLVFFRKMYYFMNIKE